MKTIFLLRDPDAPEFKDSKFSFDGTIDDFFNELNEYSSLVEIEQHQGNVLLITLNHFAKRIGTNPSIIFSELAGKCSPVASDPRVIDVDAGAFKISTVVTGHVYAYEVTNGDGTPLVKFNLSTRTHVDNVVNGMANTIEALGTLSTALSSIRDLFIEPEPDPVPDPETPPQSLQEVPERRPQLSDLMRERKVKVPQTYSVTVRGWNSEGPGIEVILQAPTLVKDELILADFLGTVGGIVGSRGMTVSGEDGRSTVIVNSELASRYEEVFLSALKNHNLDGIYTLSRREYNPEKEPGITYL